MWDILANVKLEVEGVYKHWWTEKQTILTEVSMLHYGGVR